VSRIFESRRDPIVGDRLAAVETFGVDAKQNFHAVPGTAAHWLDWRRRHQACAAWYHQRTRLSQNAEIALVRK
jgi:hypothetical protein